MRRLLLLLIAIWVVCMVMLFFVSRVHGAAYDYSFAGQTGYGTIPKAGKTASISLTNTGTVTWCKTCATPTRLGTSHSTDRQSAFLDGTLSANRIAMDQETVAPGQTATFTFKIKQVPSNPGTLNEYFQPVVDGVTWMKDIGIYWSWTTPAPVGVMVFHWYGGSGFRWYPGQGIPEWTPDTPVGGIYDSSDVTRMRTQLNQIQSAGFDFVILDWWDGAGPYGEGASIRANATMMAHLIQNEYPSLKFTFDVDNPPGGLVPLADYQYFDSEFGTNGWFKWKNSVRTTFVYGGRSQANPQGFNGIEYDNTTPDPRNNTMYWILDPARIKNRMLTIYPSFSNLSWCAGVTTCMSDDGGQTGTLWNTESAAALNNKGALDVLVEYSWNEYGERSTIEPSTSADRATNPSDKAYQWAVGLIGRWNYE